ncbi:MAG: hypothetical protein A2X85_13370 [Geobacteraceae bacterium GWF2_54_21]|nr:MAG: hypothetical protein A2X85_13370 [Geobacteraceae bacterium GWF2_54_21]
MKKIIRIFLRSAILAAFLLINTISMAQGAGFSTVAPLTDYRWSNHTATLLQNGKILVAGGFGSNGILSSAELYDPATNSWAPAGNLSTARMQHTATLLPNGKVLVTGGSGSIDTMLSSAELYDPATNNWTPAGSLATARFDHTATLLPNGKVLVVAGRYDSITFEAFTSAELYDPTANTWSPAGNISIGRSRHTATLLTNGKVFIAGGNTTAATANNADLYDPATNNWTPVNGGALTARSGHTATLLANGKVLVAGGTAATTPALEAYDPATNSWSSAGVFNVARVDHSATLLANGKVLFTGGASGISVLSSAELYDPVSNAVTSVAGAMATGRSTHTTTLLVSGKVLIVGGNPSAINSVEQYESPLSGSWLSAPPMLNDRYGHTGTLLNNGKILIVGGNGFSAFDLKSAEIYDPANKTWASGGTTSTAHSYHSATLLSNGMVLIAGGYDATGPIASTELYDPASNSWTRVQDMNTARHGHTATLLQNGKVLVTGGYNNTGYLTAAEVFDSLTNTWSTVAPLGIARNYHTATLLPDGKVLVTGGFNLAGNLASVETYDPATNIWEPGLDMTFARNSHTSTLLASGKVLVAGGDEISNTSTELYDPVLKSWSTAGNMTFGRSKHSAELLRSGKVMVIGNVATTEIYDPLANTWAIADDLAISRYRHTSAILADGSVFVAGGVVSGAVYVTASAELYSPAIEAPNLGTARSGHTSTTLPDGRILVTGEGFGGPALASAELFNPATRAWSAAAPMAMTRSHNTATLLLNGKVLVTGGDQAGVPLDSAELYNPATDTWAAAAKMSIARQRHTATLLANGKLLVAGGGSSAAELYDPVLNTWQPAGILTDNRSDHTATLLPNGKVLVAGGSGSISTTPYSAELYDPQINSWSLASSMTYDRYFHTATLLPNGKVLVAGGQSTDRASAELYDPLLDTWTLATSMNAARQTHAAVLLPSGMVLVSGGESVVSLDSIEIYDPATNLWSFAGKLAGSRHSHSANLLPDGRLLIAGGFYAVYPSFYNIATTEIVNTWPDLQESRRPLVSSAVYDPALPTQLTFTGSRLRGDSEASSDSTNNSSSGYPLLLLQRLDNEQLHIIASDPARNWTDISFVSLPVLQLPAGHYRANLVTNGIPSVSRIVLIHDTVPPAIVSFTAPSNSASLTAAPLSVTATDNSGVTAYCLSESSAATGCVWYGISPANFTFASNGVKTLYAFVRDAHENVSVPQSRNITIDTTLPAISSFTVPGVWNSYQLPVNTLVASDNLGTIAGYCISETNSAASCAWSSVKPVSFTLTPDPVPILAPKNLYAFVKDPTGNISLSATVSTVIDTVKPVVNSFTIPPTSASATIAVIAFRATDNLLLAGYCITEVNNSANCLWNINPNQDYTFHTSGTKLLHAWVKDTAGNISSPVIAVINITSSTYPLTLTLAGSGGGSINGDMNCVTGFACSVVQFVIGATITLIPTPDINSVFDGWSGSCSGTGNCTLTMLSPNVATATFSLASFILNQSSGFSYIALQDAYNNALNGNVILIQGGTILSGDLIMGNAILVTIKGGYSADYLTQGSYTTLQGNLTIGLGNLVVDRLIIK